jgi:hypothetical protein
MILKRFSSRYFGERFSSMPAFRYAHRLLLSWLCVLALLAPVRSFAVSCTLQGQMGVDTRNSILESAHKLAIAIQSGDIAAVKAQTVPAVARQFDSIAGTINTLTPNIKSASMTIDAMYALDASDLKSPEDTQFFCDASKPALHEEISIPQLPPGNYALALAHATGVKNPQQMAILMQQQGTNWQMAGFFVRPLLLAGHDSLWYWTKARSFTQRGQNWNAHFYYSTAQYLALPVDFLTTPNLQKLKGEMEGVQTAGIPGNQPVVVQDGDRSFTVTDMHPDGELGQLDLAVRYTATDTSDPVASRTHILELMKALLAQHPELRDGFHGLWVFADAPRQEPFAIEQPMSAIH